MQLELDRFGNHIYTFTNQPKIETLNYVISKVNSGVAIIFRGLDHQTVNEYNQQAKLSHQMKFQGSYDLNTLQFFIRNGSNGPEIRNNTTWAAGTSIVVKYQGQYYYLLVKDKTKNIVTSIGGFCNDAEFDSNQQYNTAIREVNEETLDYSEEKKLSNIYSLLINIEQLKPLAVVNFKSTYFGLTQMTDTYYSFRTMFDLDQQQPQPFFQRLFDTNNKDQNGNYLLSYQYNEETQYICAMKMTYDSTSFIQIKTSNELMQIAIADKNKLTHPVSSLHAFLNYLHLQHILGNKQTNYVLEGDGLVGFPPPVLKLTTN